MKNKLVLLSLLLAGTTTVVSAQTKEKSYSESWKDKSIIIARKLKIISLSVWVQEYKELPIRIVNSAKI